MATGRICISIDSDLLKEVVEMSNKEERSISKQIVHLIKNELRGQQNVQIKA